MIRKPFITRGELIGVALIGALLLLFLWGRLPAHGDPSPTTYSQYNGAASLGTVTSGTTITLGRLGSVSTYQLTLSSGTAPYSGQIVLSDTGIHPGDLYFIAVSYPGSGYPSLQVMDSSTNGTLLHSSTDTSIAGKTVLRFVNTSGTQWSFNPEGALLTRNLGTGLQAASAQPVNTGSGLVTGSGLASGTAGYSTSLSSTLSGISSPLAASAGPPMLALTSSDVVVFNLSSWDRAAHVSGTGLVGTQLPNGGYTSAWPTLLMQSAWGKNAHWFNVSTDGQTTAGALAQYNTPNTTYGVTVPSPHAIFTSGSFPGRKILITGGSLLHNDAESLITTASTVANLLQMTGSAHADTATVIMATSPVIDYWTGDYLATNPLIKADDLALIDGTQGVLWDGLARMDAYLPNQAYTPWFPDNLHGSALAAQIASDNWEDYLSRGAQNIPGDFGINNEGTYFGGGLSVDTLMGPIAINLNESEGRIDLFNDGTNFFGVSAPASSGSAVTFLYASQYTGSKVSIAELTSSGAYLDKFDFFVTGQPVETATANLSLTGTMTVTGPLVAQSGSFSSAMFATSGTIGTITSSVGFYTGGLTVTPSGISFGNTPEYLDVYNGAGSAVLGMYAGPGNTLELYTDAVGGGSVTRGSMTYPGRLYTAFDSLTQAGGDTFYLTTGTGTLGVSGTAPTWNGAPWPGGGGSSATTLTNGTFTTYAPLINGTANDTIVTGTAHCTGTNTAMVSGTLAKGTYLLHAIITTAAGSSSNFNPLFRYINDLTVTGTYCGEFPTAGSPNNWNDFEGNTSVNQASTVDPYQEITIHTPGGAFYGAIISDTSGTTNATADFVIQQIGSQ